MISFILGCNEERMGKIEGGEERFLKKILIISPIHKIYIRKEYINLIIQFSFIVELLLILICINSG